MKEPKSSTPPYIVFKRWGQIRDHAEAEMVPDASPNQREQRGFYLGNAGGSAFEVMVQDFRISASVNAHSTMINCLSAGEEGFAPIGLNYWRKELSAKSLLADLAARWDLIGAVAKAADAIWIHRNFPQEYAIAISVVYRDADDFWYRSSAKLIYTKQPDVSFVRPRKKVVTHKGERSFKFGPTKRKSLGSSPFERAGNPAGAPKSVPEGVVAADKSGQKGDLTLLQLHDGRQSVAVSFRTAELYADISPRRRQQLMKQGLLRVVGEGQNRRITVQSLIAYCPPVEEAK
jgi:hypothetical protein